MYIHALGLCRGYHSIGSGGDRSGLRVWFCAGQRIRRSFDINGGGVRGMLVFELVVAVSALC